MILLYITIILVVFWILYLAVANLYKAYQAKAIPRTTLPLAYLVLMIGGTVDIVLNFTLFALIFLDAPQEVLVTQRLKRYIKFNTGWRYKLAKWICTTLLNPFEKNNNHCS